MIIGKHILSIISPPLSKLGQGLKRSRQWQISLALLLIILILQTIAQHNPALVEDYYSRGLYPKIGQLLSALNQYASGSLAELLVILSLVTFLTYLIYQLRRLYLRLITRIFLLEGIFKQGVSVGSIGLMIFFWSWGFNYQRQPLYQNLAWKPRPANATELETVCRAMILATNKSYQALKIHPESGKSTQMPLDWHELNNSIEIAYQTEPLLKGLTSGVYAPAKAVYGSHIMTRLGITGIYMPFTGEPNVNIEPPDCDRPFTLAHEKAHQRGFALEDEANFIAFLVCTRSNEEYNRYSGYLMASIYLINAFARVAPLKSGELYKLLEPGPKADLQALNAFWQRYQGRLNNFSKFVNNAYLKANKVNLGIKSYNAVVQLMVDYYFVEQQQGKSLP